MLRFPAATIALVLIDLQKGIVSRSLAPRSGPEVVEAAKTLAQRFRVAKAPVVIVNVAFAEDMGDALRQPVDQPASLQGEMPPDFSTLADGLLQPGDLRVTKHNWGAFYGTDLDVQLRRRGIKTVALGGIATNMGVESTARQGYERGYEMVVVEDMMTGLSAEMHNFAVKSIMPMIGRVATVADIALDA